MPLFELDLHDNGGILKPETVDELWKWIEDQQAAWSWVKPELNSAFRSRISDRHLALRDWIAHTLPRGVGATYKPEDVEQIVAVIREYYTGPDKTLHPSHPDARFIAELRASAGDDVALGALFHLVESQAQLSLQMGAARMTGQVRAVMYQGGVVGLLESERVALTALRGDARSLLETVQREAATAQAGFEQSLHGVRKHLEEVQSSTKHELVGLVKLYSEQMQLEAPVKYWEKQREKHRNRAASVATATLLIGGTGAWALWYYLARHLAGVDVTVSRLNPVQVGELVVLLALYLWGVRILVRLLLSNLHLEIDSGERAVMAKTYLAMVKDQRIAEDDRKLVLAPLFRPAATGIVKDDAAPPSWSDLVSRLISGGK